MSLTWLDRYIHAYADDARSKSIPGKLKKESDASITSWGIGLTLSTRKPSSIDVLFQNRALSYIRQMINGGSEVVGISPSRTLVEDLASASFQYGAITPERNLYYVDIPFGIWPAVTRISGEELSIVAMIIAIGIDGDCDISVTLIYINDNWSKTRFSAWIYKFDTENGDLYCHDMERPESKHGSDPSEMAFDVIELSQRLIAYLQSPDGIRSLEPYASSSEMSKIYDIRRRRETQGDRSIFRIARLGERPIVNGSSSTGAGNPLQWRTSVRGHYRWQPCGPAHKDRRLIWINEHEKGPEGAPRKVDLFCLKEKPRPNKEMRQ